MYRDRWKIDINYDAMADENQWSASCADVVVGPMPDLPTLIAAIKLADAALTEGT